MASKTPHALGMKAAPAGMQAGRQMRFTQEELDLIKKHFDGNEELLAVMRKVFLPEFDPKAPIGELIDLWTVPEITDDNALLDQSFVNMRARGKLVKHLDTCLVMLRSLGNLSNKERDAARNSTR